MKKVNRHKEGSNRNIQESIDSSYLRTIISSPENYHSSPKNYHSQTQGLPLKNKRDTDYEQKCTNIDKNLKWVLSENIKVLSKKI